MENKSRSIVLGQALSVLVALIIQMTSFGCSCGRTGGEPHLDGTHELTGFAFTSAHNPGLTTDVTGELSGDQVTVIVPEGTDPSSLVADFTFLGESVTVGGVPQESGVTAQDFTSPVVYRVTAEDGSFSDYTVRVFDASSDARDIVRFRVLGIDATITGADVALILPYGADRSALAPEVTITGVSVTPPSGAVVDFTDSESTPVTYTVTAADGGTKTYAVRIAVASSDAKDIVSFVFRAADNGAAGLLFDAPGQIDGEDIVVMVNHDTDVTGLVADFVLTGTGATAAGVLQVPRTTANDFSAPVVYTVSAGDGSTRDFTVTVSVTPPNAKDLTSFVLPAGLNPGLAHDAVGLFTGTNVVVIIPAGAARTSLVPVFATTGVRVDADEGGGAVVQTSGVSVVDFSLGSVAYIVTAGDGSQKYYDVNVVEAGPSDRSLLAFGFLAADNPDLARDCLGVISEGNPGAVSITVPFGTPLTNLRARFASSGVGVTVAGLTQVSAVTTNDFTPTLTYRVTAADATTRDYLVTVTIAPSDANSLTAFSFETAANPVLVVRTEGVVTEGAPGAVAVTVPYGTPVTGLVASFTTTGTRVTVGGVTQFSGVSVQDYSAPLVFTVHAADGATRNYLVTVTVAPHAPPVVISVVPSDGAVGTNLRATFTITFNERMRPTTLTANTTNTTCAGYTFQVSRDNFATCLRLKNFTVTNNPTITFQPRVNMTTLTLHKIRILGGPAGVACDDFGVNMVSNRETSFTTR